MKIKSKVFKRKTGKSAGVWVARLSYFDEINGRQRFEEMHAVTRTAACDRRDKRIEELQVKGVEALRRDRFSFEQLAEKCLAGPLQPAVISEGRRVAGIRSHGTVAGHVRMLKLFFGTRLVSSITAGALDEYKVWRLRQGAQRGKKEEIIPISLMTVNRELSTLRKMLNHARDERWLLSEPPKFRKAIDRGAEQVRSRELSRAEEVSLLNACSGIREITYRRTRFGKEETITATHKINNLRLRAAIILAIDSAMRRGEIRRLEWRDIDVENQRIIIRAANAKSQKSRIVPLSQRAASELEKIRSFEQEKRPFPFGFETAFRNVKEQTGINDLRFHDLRRTALTRWVQAGFSLSQVAKIAGHADAQITGRHYIAAGEDLVTAIAHSMDSNVSTSQFELTSVN